MSTPAPTHFPSPTAPHVLPRSTLKTMDQTIGVRELNQHTRQVLDHVRAGDVVVVTDRGIPVARIVPYSSDPFETLVAEGHVTPATTSPSLPTTTGRRPTHVTLDEMREDRV